VVLALTAPCLCAHARAYRVDELAAPAANAAEVMASPNPHMKAARMRFRRLFSGSFNKVNKFMYNFCSKLSTLN
jgi:hypothetical protein